jgi:glycosyltransferase involved in cell wall biosynthesis
MQKAYYARDWLLIQTITALKMTSSKSVQTFRADPFKDGISVIILSMNNGDTLEACLKSVLNAPPYDKEIIVVDGHSKDNTHVVLEKYRDKIQVIYDEGKGIGLARNLGVENSKHGIIAFLDSDVICAKNHFTTLLKYYYNHPEVGAADIRGSHPQIGTKIQRLESLYRETVETYFSSQKTLRGWSISFRKSAFKDVGGFWRRGSEDTEFSHKLQAKGYRMASLNSASWHIPRPTVRGICVEMSNWGKTAAYYHYSLSHNRMLYEDFYSRNRFFRMLPNVKVMVVVTYLFAPLTGIRYFAKTKSFELYCYFLLVHAAYLWGYLRETHNAPKRFKREQLRAVS